MIVRTGGEDAATPDTAGPAPAGGYADVAPNLTPPPGNPRFPLFDSLRAIAALAVFLGHTVTGTISLSQHPDLFVFAVQLADQGVAIFFLISGFLLYRPFVVARRGGRPIRLSDFARRRALRIVPAYWVALSVFIVLGWVSGVTTHNWPVFYGFVQNHSSSTIGNGIGAAWTLCIEVTFYVALPVLAWLAGSLGGGRESLRGDLVLLFVLSVCSLVFRINHTSLADIAIVSTLAGTFLWFALGMALAIASVAAGHDPQRYPAVRAVIRRPDVCWVTAALGTVLLFALTRRSSSSATAGVAYVAYGLIALFVLLPGVFGDTAGGLPRGVLRLRRLAWVGLISYSFYLYHTIVIEQVDKRVSTGNAIVRYIVVLVISAIVSCAVSAASYYLVERPMMRVRGRRGPRFTAPRRSAGPRDGTPTPRVTQIVRYSAVAIANLTGPPSAGSQGQGVCGFVTHRCAEVEDRRQRIERDHVAQRRRHRRQIGYSTGVA